MLKLQKATITLKNVLKYNNHPKYKNPTQLPREEIPAKHIALIDWYT